MARQANDVIDPAQSAEWARPKDAETGRKYRKEGRWRDRTYLDDFLDAVRSHPSKMAVSAYGDDPLPRVLTYAQLELYTRRFARTLRELGVKKGDVVALQLPTSWEVGVVSLAIMRIGAVPNPIPTTYRERELTFMLDHARTRVFVTSARDMRGFSHANLARQLQEKVASLEHLVGIRGAAEGMVDFEASLVSSPNAPDPTLQEMAELLPGPDDQAVVLFTSGTTGMAKAVVHTYNTLFSGARHVDAAGLNSSDVGFIAATMGHTLGYVWGMLVPMAQGMTIVYQETWNARQMIELANLERVTWTFSSTPLAVDLLEAQRASGVELETFRVYICGGTKAPPQVIASTSEQLDVEMLPMWGTSEMGICAIHGIGSSLETLTGSDGMPVPQMTFRLVDDEDREVERGAEGHLEASGSSEFLGYLHQGDLTAAAYTDDGWFRTGDRGVLTPNGGLLFAGRTKDIIVRGGQNVPVIEIENELSTHPMVAEVVVVAIPDARLGEQGCAVIIPKGDPPTLEDLQKHLDEAGMTKQFWPERVEIVQEYPRTPLGKIQKFRIREQLSEQITAEQAH